MDPQSPVILLVEPDPFGRLQLIRMLNDSGYSVRSAGEPSEAVDIFVADHPRIALVFWRARMLGGAGDQLREALQGIASDVPVLAVDRMDLCGHTGGGCFTHRLADDVCQVQAEQIAIVLPGLAQ
mgnify:CR=1 FL=1